jgi:pimeloyl-ACP methyl ester carboxylesterase
MDPVPVRVAGHELRIAVDRAGGGAGVPLVFLHGLGSSTTGLLPIAEHSSLAAHPHLLIDLPGFGESAAPDGWPATIEAQAAAVVAVLDALAVDRAALVGHSMGGSVAIALAHGCPGRAERLIVAEPLLDPGVGTLSTHIARQTEGEFVRRGFAALRMVTRRQAARGDIAAIGFLRTLEMADPAIMHRSAVSLLASRRPTFREQLTALDIPRVFIAGARSGIDATPLRAVGVATVLVPEAGHSMMDENPDGFARAIAATCRRS